MASSITLWNFWCSGTLARKHGKLSSKFFIVIEWSRGRGNHIVIFGKWTHNLYGLVCLWMRINYLLYYPSLLVIAFITILIVRGTVLTSDCIRTIYKDIVILNWNLSWNLPFPLIIIQRICMGKFSIVMM